MDKNYTHDELMVIAENMKKFGGSFVVALAECIYRADDTNKRKLIATFPEYFETYLTFGQ